MKNVVLLLVALVANVVLSAVQADIVRVIDGDTVVARVEGRDVRVRMAHIDAPESTQKGGQESKAALAAKVEGRRVTLNIEGNDQYGRSIATIEIDGRNVNKEMVQEGQAWQYRFDRSTEYGDAHRSARRNKVGVWKDGKAIDPYKYRRSRR